MIELNKKLVRAGWYAMAALVMIPGSLAIAGSSADAVRERLSFDSGWRFIKGDPDGTGAELSYGKIKDWVIPTGNDFTTNGARVRPEGDLGADVAFTQSGFDDSAWRQLNLPHDWGIEGPLKQEYSGETGKLPWWGVAWYRKHFDVAAADKGGRVYLDVDGAMSYANVWLNGHYVGGWPYGYSSWEVDLTPYLKYGAENVLAIRLDNPQHSSRWYPGGGIYRNVWLVKTSPVHVAHWGTYVTTPEASSSAATVKIQVKVANDAGSDCTVSVKNQIYAVNARGGRGKAVASVGTDGLAIAAGQTQSAETQVSFKNPKLWSLEKPQRYVVVTSIERNGSLADSYETPFGVRAIKFDPARGFFLNGEHVHLNGVCDHADLGALGTAINTRGLERQIEILKEMGCNAIRTSHNPPAPELLDLCDRMGMLVMDESFDCWKKGKRPNDYHLLFDDWHERDWRAELRRDRNHPCVVLWSIGNEISEQGMPQGWKLAAELSGIAHQEDPTRPTTAACNNGESAFNGFGTNLDVFGYNYHPTKYAAAHLANPALPIFGSETASCISSRGEYFYPVHTNQDDGKANCQVSSYDLSAPAWATIPDTEFTGQDNNPFVAGEFVWTGFDYLGEPTPYDSSNSTSRSSYFGIVDLAGLKKDRFYLYQARWRPELRMAHIVPQCWNWPDRVGQITPVYVYTSGDEAELFLNGQSLGRKKKGTNDYRLIWNDVAYQPGEVKVTAYKNGQRWANDNVKTTGPAAKLSVKADRVRIGPEQNDLSFITVTVEDENGLIVPQAANLIHFQITGPGEIAAADNGDPTEMTSFQSPDRKAFNGQALVVIRSSRGTGAIAVSATSPGLLPSEVKIQKR